MRIDFHDGLLERLLGPGPREYPWGRVMSIHDSKGGGTFILVRYA